MWAGVPFRRGGRSASLTPCCGLLHPRPPGTTSCVCPTHPLSPLVQPPPVVPQEPCRKGRHPNDKEDDPRNAEEHRHEQMGTLEGVDAFGGQVSYRNKMARWNAWTTEFELFEFNITAHPYIVTQMLPGST